MQKFSALVFALMAGLIVVLSRARDWSWPGRAVLMMFLAANLLGFLLSLFPQRAEK